MTTRAESYERGAQIVLNLVRDWSGEPPRFRFPPREIALLADLRDVGQRLALNDGASELVELLVKRCLERTGQAPTALMLRVVLEQLHIPIETVPLSSLGLSVGTS